jgi:hypothetical protein
MGEAAYAREANRELNEKMVREGMELGAIGFSTSPRGGPAIHAGTPSTFAEHDEIIALANVTDEYNGCFQFNGFQMVLQPESGVPEMLSKIHGLQIGNEFRQRRGHRTPGPCALGSAEARRALVVHPHPSAATIDDSSS